MRLTQIRDFLAVVECGGIRPAARKLGVAQPTITKSVRSLEDELHVQLFARKARGILPTAAGRAFFSRAHVAHAELSKAAEEALGGSSSGSVAFGIGPVGVARIVPPAIASFQRQFPHAHVRIVEGLAHVLLPQLREEALDFVVGVRPKDVGPVLKYRPLFRSAMCVVARKDHPLRHARSLEELAGADWVAMSMAGRPSELVARLHLDAGLAPPSPVILCESINTVVAVLAKSDMVTTLQRLHVKESVARDMLREIPISLPSVSIGLFTRADTPLTRVAAAMAKCVTAAVRGGGRMV
jgi:DNA-binding transcriptional LysR family regulator